MVFNRKTLIVGGMAFAGLLVIALFAFKGSRSAAPLPAESPSSAPIAGSETNIPAVAIGARADNNLPQPTPSIEAAKVQPATVSSLRTPQQLVAELLEISSTEGPITAETAEKFKRNLEELIKQGAASVSAIREFLDKKMEYDFADVPGGEQMGYASLRAGMIDALRQIGGPEAQEAMVQVLQTSALPAELLAIANNLDQEAPGLYRDAILNAARESLAMAGTNPAAANIELGPAFRIIQNYGAANTTAEAAQNEPANFDNAINLAKMPEGQGLAALVQMSENASSASGQTIATEMIAQMAGENSKAADALMQMAQNGKISNGTWEKLAPFLGGDEYQIAQSSNGNPDAPQYPGYTIVNNASTSDQINQRIALIDQFLTVVPSDSSAAASLRNQRNLLNGKLGR